MTTRAWRPQNMGREGLPILTGAREALVDAWAGSMWIGAVLAIGVGVLVLLLSSGRRAAADFAADGVLGDGVVGDGVLGDAVEDVGGGLVGADGWDGVPAGHPVPAGTSAMRDARPSVGADLPARGLDGSSDRFVA